MELTDIAPKETWIALQEELSARFGFNADVVDKEGKKMQGLSFGNELCKALFADKKGFGAICVTAGASFVELAKQGKPFTEECDALMMRVSVPVIKDGEHVGAVGGCGLLSAEEEIDEFTIGMMSDLEEDRITELGKTVKTFTEDDIEEIKKYIQKRIDEILG